MTVFTGSAAAPTSGDSQSSSRAVIKPAGATVGIFFVSFWIGDGDVTITPPSGAVLRNNTVVVDTRTATYLKYVDGDATGATYTFSWVGSKWSALKAIFFSDVDLTLDLSLVPFNTANAAGTGYATTTVTTVLNAALVWNGNAAEYSTAPTHTPPTNFTETNDTTLSASAYRISPGTGSQSASSAAASVAVNNKISSLVAIASAASADQDLNVGFFDNVESIFPVTITNQANQDLNLGTISSSVQFFSPSVANQSNQDLAPGFIASTTQLFLPSLSVGDLNLDIPFTQFTTTFFAPSVANQANQDANIGFISSTAQIFIVSIANQSNDTFLPNFVQFSQLFFTPTVFNEGEQVFEPILAGNGSHADQIFEGLVSQGFLTGSILDRERARLLAKLVLVEPQALSLQDLYSLANEDPRVLGLFGEVLPV